MRTLHRYCLLALGIPIYLWLLLYDFSGQEEEECTRSEQSFWTESGESLRLQRHYGATPCSFQSCFDFSRCLSDRPKVYVYPSQPGIVLSPTYSKILTAIRESAYYTSKPAEACLFVLSVDTVDRDKESKNYVKELNALIDTLPAEIWNGGQNHVIFNLYHGTYPEYADHNLGFNTGKAIIARASPSVQHYRLGFDISFPLFHQEHHLRAGPEKFLDLRLGDGHLLSFKGKRYVYGIGSETRDALYHLHNGHSVAMLTTCKHNADWKDHQDYRCQQDNEEYDKWDYEATMANSTFCLTPRGRRLGSFRFLESLRVGCIPVVLSDDWVLPFEEVIDWSKAAVVVAEENVLLTPELLRDISEEKVIRMKEQGRFLYNRYFRDVESISLTTLRIIFDRIRRSEGYFTRSWNSQDVPTTKINGSTALVVLCKTEDLAKSWAGAQRVYQIDEIVVLWPSGNPYPSLQSSYVKFLRPEQLDQLHKVSPATFFFFVDEKMKETSLSAEDMAILLRYLRIYPDRLVGIHGIDFDPTLMTVNFATLYNAVYPSLMAVQRESLVQLSESFPAPLIRQCFAESLNLATSDRSGQPPVVVGRHPVLAHMQNSKSIDCWKLLAGRLNDGLPLHYSDLHYG